ncbi:uncharacterized protein LOC116164175 [Photinus pyralis]|uniref:uncharacterized protein LOC116164175 n=1 Tax=Photinus pyralis TaxID=7054 RepID=UPI001267369C|nr:uncharacterized protein LOC116164175 [Photinus pyralis]
MSESNDSGHSETEINVKKRRHEKEWKRNKIKRLKAEGKAHVNWKGRLVPARSTGDSCSCKRLCFSKFSADSKQHILDQFNKLGSDGNKIAQDTYLQGLISAHAIKKRRPRKETPSSTRCASYTYKIKIGNEETPVCTQAFCSLHGIKPDRVKRLARLVNSGLVSQEQRGKHNTRPNQVSSQVLMLIDQHIRSFPYRVSHYAASNKKRRYLASTLSITKMYELFLQKHDSEAHRTLTSKKVSADKIHGVASYRTFLKYFRDHFNYGFGRPQVDKCRECEQLNVKIQTEKNVTIREKLQAQLKVHKVKGKTFYNEIKRCTTLAKNNDDTEMITFDYEQNLPVPVTNVSDEFYLRQLWVYNFGVHGMSDDKQVMYMYDETVAKKGCSEVTSMLKHYIDNYVPVAVRKLYVFSDGCTGQNKNHTLVEFFFSLIKTGRFDYIEQRYPIRGHSYLPNDRDFAKIEVQKRKQGKVEIPQRWYEIVREDCKFEVVEVNRTMIFDFKKHFTNIFKKNITNASKEKFLISEAKIIKYSISHINEIAVSTAMSGILFTNFRIMKPNTKISMPTRPMYDEPIPVKEKKIANLKLLIQYLSEEGQQYFTRVFEGGTNPEDAESDSDTEYL